MKQKLAKIAVIGLSGQSIFMHLDDFPIPSVTTHAKSYYEEPGGKGYNQAVACSKLGCKVSYLSKVGNDCYGKYCKDYMESLNIKTFFIKDSKEKTALATILILKNGENEVIVNPGASKNLNYEDLIVFSKEIIDANVLLLQYEINIDIVKKAISIAKEAKIITILNPAPAIYNDQKILESVDILTPNLEEAKKLYCLPHNISIDDMGKYLAEKVSNILIITLGNKGCLLIQNKKYKYYPAFKVTTVDTTGAGDIFNATLATMIAKKNSIDEAIKYAMAAAALSVTRPYVINAIPNNDEICKFLKLYNLKEKY